MLIIGLGDLCFAGQYRGYFYEHLPVGGVGFVSFTDCSWAIAGASSAAGFKQMY